MLPRTFGAYAARSNPLHKPTFSISINKKLSASLLCLAGAQHREYEFNIIDGLHITLTSLGLRHISRRPQ